MNSTERTPKDLRMFGVVMTVAFGIIGGIVWWNEGWVAPYLFAIAGVFLLAGLLAPMSLLLTERLWMAFAERLGVVMTYVILTLTFFLIVTPMGLLVRLLGKDLLLMKLEPDMESYWVPVEKDGPATRFYTPY